jgi:hypothetical protein
MLENGADWASELQANIAHPKRMLCSVRFIEETRLHTEVFNNSPTAIF